MAEGVQTALPMMADSVPAAASDYSAMFVLLVTVVGFVLPMLFVYPPVRPRPSDFLDETHSRLGADEVSEVSVSEVSEAKDAPGDLHGGRLSGLWIYPIEACRGIRLSRTRVLPSGLELDRLLTFAQRKADGWVALAPVHFGRLAALQVELWRPDRVKAQRWQDRMRASDSADRASTLAQTFVLVRYPWGPERRGAAGLWERLSAKLARGWRAVPEVEIVFPLEDEEASAEAKAETKAQAKNTAASTTVARRDGRVVPAIDLSAELDPSLQLYLGVSNRLGLFRIVDPKPTAPVCLVNSNNSSSSLDQQQLCPNIVLSGVPTNDKDSWKTVRFSPSLPGADDLLDARFHVEQDTDGHRLLLTPLFARQDGPEPLELTIDVGMAVNIERDE